MSIGPGVVSLCSYQPDSVQPFLGVSLAFDLEQPPAGLYGMAEIARDHMRGPARTQTHPNEAGSGESNVLAGGQLVGRSRQILDARSDQTPFGHRCPEEDGPFESAGYSRHHALVA